MANLVLLMAHPFPNRSAEKQATREALLSSRLKTVTECSASGREFFLFRTVELRSSPIQLLERTHYSNI